MRLDLGVFEVGDIELGAAAGQILAAAGFFHAGVAHRGAVAFAGHAFETAEPAVHAFLEFDLEDGKGRTRIAVNRTVLTILMI